MQVENKYYIPAISEFHVGFEVEEWINSHPEGFWSEVDIKLNKDQLSDLLLATETEISQQYRVKYLNHYDLKELGWELKEEDCYKFYKEPHQFTLFNTEGLLAIYKGFGGELLEPRRVIFFGMIKNKSELRRLMQQLSIA